MLVASQGPATGVPVEAIELKHGKQRCIALSHSLESDSVLLGSFQ